MNISKIKRMNNVLELIEADRNLITDIEIETIGDTLYITSIDTDLLDVLENLVDFNVADDYMNGEDRYIKISIKL
jgi:hypothetical protein